MKRSHDGSIIGRREFLKCGVLAGVGVSILPLARDAAAAIEAAPKVRRYSTLGRTGLKISDISFGSSRLTSGNEDLVRHAYDCGINYFDSADTYTDGESETTVGNALKGKRDKVYLTSKQMAQADDKRASMMATLEGSLRRLQTDHVDVYFNHAVNDPARLKNPEWHEFVADARKQGKIRFTGMSGHAGNLAQCLDYAIDSGQFDVILCAHNFGQDPRFFQRFTRNFDFVARQPELPRIMEKAQSKGVGVVVMKTLMGARLNDMRPYESGGATFSQAAFRWVLSNKNVDALIVTMTSQQMIDEYLGASGARTTAGADLPLLNRYATLNGDSQCRPACNECADACPFGVPISDVMRTRMYARDYGDIRMGRSEYAMLASNAAACLTCDAKPCAGACPHGIAIDVLLAPTHRMLA
jgi:predicted aldo/keto reductase-like oxidoreductase